MKKFICTMMVLIVVIISSSGIVATSADTDDDEDISLKEKWYQYIIGDPSKDNGTRSSSPTPSPEPTPDPIKEPSIELSDVPVQRKMIMVDDLNDLSKVYEASRYLIFEKGNPEQFQGDTSRVARTNFRDRSIAYKTQGDISYFKVDTYFWSGDPGEDFRFYIGESSRTYRELLPKKHELDGSWKRVTYECSAVPRGIRYLKIEFQSSSKYAWTNQIGRVEIHSLTEYDVEISGKDCIQIPLNGSVPVQYEVKKENDFAFDFKNNEVVWSSYGLVPGQDIKGVTVGGSGEVIVDSSAQAGKFMLEAAIETDQGKFTKTKIVQLLPAPSVASSIEIVGPDIIRIPSEKNLSTKYAAVVKDQYGVHMDDEKVIWLLEGRMPAGVAVNLARGRVFVDAATQPGMVVLKAMSSTNNDILAIKRIKIRPESAITDEFDDLSNVYQHSSNLTLKKEYKDQFDGDASRLTSNNALPGYIVYKTDKEIGYFAADTYFWSDAEGPTFKGLKFYVSKDGSNYMEFLPIKTVIESHRDDRWNVVIYEASVFPKGTRYLKIELGAQSDQDDKIAVQIGRVEISVK